MGFPKLLCWLERFVASFIGLSGVSLLFECFCRSSSVLLFVVFLAVEMQAWGFKKVGGLGLGLKSLTCFKVWPSAESLRCTGSWYEVPRFKALGFSRLSSNPQPALPDTAQV